MTDVPPPGSNPPRIDPRPDANRMHSTRPAQTSMWLVLLVVAAVVLAGIAFTMNRTAQPTDVIPDEAPPPAAAPTETAPTEPVAPAAETGSTADPATTAPAVTDTGEPGTAPVDEGAPAETTEPATNGTSQSTP
jgi:hypothetical protein